MENKAKFKPNPNLKLIDQVKEVLRYYHYAYKTETSYLLWIKKYIYFYNAKVHPKDMGSLQVERFLSHIAVEDKVSASTQRQALNALLFLYNEVLRKPLKNISPIRSKRFAKPPTVLTKEEVGKLLLNLTGTNLLLGKLLYGSGLRLLEALRLRIQDIDFGQNQIYIRGGKGGKDRTSLLPANIKNELQLQIQKATLLHHKDLEEGYGEVDLPGALDKKLPNASKETRWQYVFPSRERSADPRTGKIMRHHMLESNLQKAVKHAADLAQITKRVTCHTLRHSFATHMLENGINIRILQVLMGHSDVKTTEIYTHVMNKNISKIKSPLDILVQ